MNRYETWLSQQPTIEISLVDRIRQLYYDGYHNSTLVVWHTPAQLLEPQSAVDAQSIGTGVMPPLSRGRAEHRIQTRQAQNHCNFRAYLGYGQGTRRRS